MFKRTRVSAGVLAALGGAVLATTPALAQQTTTSTAQPAQTITVTGSRILRNDSISSSPLYTVGLDSMGDLGLENFADMATQLPQFAPAFGSSRTQSTFSGVATSGLNLANLRNLSGVRSLVLINGRRVPGGTSTSESVDFNTIPTANIERIEIITGGASAIYGADAVAGVINIITNKRFEGLEIGASYGEAARNDNTNPSGHLMFGTRFGSKGNALMTLQIDQQGRVSCRDREICAEDFAWLAPATQVRGPAAYSGVGLGGRFFVGPNAYTRRDGSFTNAAGALIPFNVTIDGYNRNADRDIAIPTKRIMAAAELEYEITPGIRAFGEFNYGSTNIKSQFEGHPFQSQAAGSLFGTLQATIPVTNPFIPAPLLAAINTFNATATPANQITNITWWQRFNNAGGPRGAESDRNSIRTVFGFKGDLPSLVGFGRDWKWEASHVFGRTNVNLNTEGLVSTSNLYYGLRVEPDPARPGQYRCVDVAARSQGCVPINPFADYTPEMQRALSIGSVAIGRSSMNNSVVSFTGPLMELPAGSMRAVAGLEYRTFSGFLDRDVVVNNALATGNQISDTDYAKTSTKEAFAELAIPILADKAFAKQLNIEGALRYSDTKKDSYNTWKLGGDWEPVDGLRFRVMQAKSVRAPNPGELSGIGLTAGVINDPCTAARRNTGPNPTVRAANCATDGIPATYSPPLVVEQSVSGLSGGNADLKPEQGKTLTFGAVWEPKAVKGLSLKVDRFKIDMDDIITTVSRQIAVDKCYDTVERALCGAITRGANPVIPGATYVLTAVNEQLQNVAKYNIAGVDFDVRYVWGLGNWGDLETKLLATRYDKATLLPLVGSDEIDLLGQAGGSTSDQGFIKFTANANATWRFGKWRTNWNLRHIGKADMAVGTTAAGFPQIGAHTYHNVRVGYEVTKGGEVFLGINNITDKQPPFFASGTSGTQALDTVPGYYDVFGRSYYAGLRLRF